MDFNKELDRAVNYKAEDRVRDISNLVGELLRYADVLENGGIRQVSTSGEEQRKINLVTVLNAAHTVSFLRSLVDGIDNRLQEFSSFYEGVKITKAIKENSKE